MEDFKSKIAANQQLIFILVATACFIGLAYYVYITYVAKGQYIPNKEFTDIPGVAEDDFDNHDNHTVDKNYERVDIYFFWASWCPHSTEAKTVWDNFVPQAEGGEIPNRKYKNKYTIYFNSIRCDAEGGGDDIGSKSFMDKYNVEGYPTIILQHGTNVIEYNAKPNVDTLTHFIANTLV